MTAEPDDFTHHVESVWTWPEADGQGILWRCECGFKPKTRTIRPGDRQNPGEVVRESHFNHVRKVRQRESAGRNEPISA